MVGPGLDWVISISNDLADPAMELGAKFHDSRGSRMAHPLGTARHRRVRKATNRRRWKKLRRRLRHAEDNGFLIAQPAFGFVLVCIMAILTLALVVYVLKTQ